MSININNFQGFNPANLVSMNSMPNTLSSAGSGQSGGILQQLSALFSALSQMFSQGSQGTQGTQGSQNPPFSTNSGSCNIGDLLSRNLGNRLEQPMNAERAAGQVNKDFGQLDKNADGVVDRSELESAKSDSNLSSRTKSAANFLLNNQDAMNKVDTADQKALGQSAQADGRISKGDTVATMAQGNSSQPAGYRDAVATLKEHKNDIQDSDGTISKGTLATIAETGRMPNGSQAPDDLKKAADYLTQKHPEKFAQLDDTNFYRNPGSTTNKADGKIGQQDLDTALAQ